MRQQEPSKETIANGRRYDIRRRIGVVLILTGVSVWGIWLVVKLAGGDPDVSAFLPFHLAGVVPGSVLSRWDSIRRLMNRR